MARFNEILAPRFARGIQKLFGIKGRVPTPVLSSEIQVVHPLISGLENRYLEGWQTYALELAVAAGGAGTFSSVRLRNPLASQTLAVIEKVVAISLGYAADTPEFSLDPVGIISDLANLITVEGFDPRTVGLPTGDSTKFQRSSCVLSFGTPVAAAGANIIHRQPLGLNAIFDLILYENQEIVLAPGAAFAYFSPTANVPIAMSIRWRERFLEDPERQ